MKKPNNKIRAVIYGYGILNADGEFWTREVFRHEQDAYMHLEDCMKKWKWNLSQHSVIPVKITPLLKRKSLKTKKLI